MISEVRKLRPLKMLIIERKGVYIQIDLKQMSKRVSSGEQLGHLLYHLHFKNQSNSYIWFKAEVGKRLDSKYFSLCKPCDLGHSYSTLLLCKGSHTQSFT